MQRCSCDMQSQEEEEEAMNIFSSSCKCSGASSILSTNEQVDEGMGCIMTKAQAFTTHMSISLYNESKFLPSSGNAPSCDAATCTTADKTVKCDGASLIRPRSKEDADDDDNNACCITPKAHKHRIPRPLACPPPPHKKLKKKQKIDQIVPSPFDAAMKPKVMNNFYDYTTHNFFNPPDLQTYPDCIRALFKS